MSAEDFIRESNRIEGIHREPTGQEIAEFVRFISLTQVTLRDCEEFVGVYQPDAKLRSKANMNVRIGNHFPLKGGMRVVYQLENILSKLYKNTPYKNHVMFETLHPFTDCNGRLGRMIWMWQMKEAPLGFLHHFYYQSLDGSRR